jgi:hypothetical protein
MIVWLKMKSNQLIKVLSHFITQERPRRWGDQWYTRKQQLTVEGCEDCKGCQCWWPSKQNVWIKWRNCWWILGKYPSDYFGYLLNNIKSVFIQKTIHLSKNCVFQHFKLSQLNNNLLHHAKTPLFLKVTLLDLYQGIGDSLTYKALYSN